MKSSPGSTAASPTIARVDFTVDLNNRRSAYQDDVITLGRTYRYPWTAAHEYTHALHDVALGGFWDVTNCNPHWVWSPPSSYTCALQEGIADYGGNVGAPDNYLHGDWESDARHNPSPKSEGSVAALFHDLIDSRNEDDDETTYGGNYVITVFKTCRVGTTFPFSRPRETVADLVWCLERRVDEDVHEDSFPGLDVTTNPTEGASEPTSWNADNIRSTWLQNLVG